MMAKRHNVVCHTSVQAQGSLNFNEFVLGSLASMRRSSELAKVAFEWGVVTEPYRGRLVLSIFLMGTS